ncbi:MAG TPA: TIGR03546 family protein [Spirochaetales bacterium]|nr:TIGR03546 family protein [Spirochaetales bacterium]
MFIKKLARLIVALNSNVSRGQLAAGMATGVLLALVPSGNLLWIALFFISFMTKANYGMTMLVMGVGKLLVPLLARPIDGLGAWLLRMTSLRGLFERLYDLPVLPLTRFNNTLVMGGLAIGALLWLPLFFAMRALIHAYRENLAPKIAGSKLVKAFFKIPLAQKLADAVSTASRLARAFE